MASPSKSKRQKTAAIVDSHGQSSKPAMCVSSGAAQTLFAKKPWGGWASQPLPEEMVKERWPSRLANICAAEAQDLKGQRKDGALQHFERMLVNPASTEAASSSAYTPDQPFEVALGDDVEVMTSSGTRVAKVVEMWMDGKDCLIRPHWFLRPLETCLATKMNPEDVPQESDEEDGEIEDNEERGKRKRRRTAAPVLYIPTMESEHPGDGLRDDRVWLSMPSKASEVEVLPVEAILRPVIVKFIIPGSPAPSKTEGWFDYWCDQTLDTHFNSFVDLHDFSLLSPALDVHALPPIKTLNPKGAKKAPATTRVPPKAQLREAEERKHMQGKTLKVLELCAGAGGLSFIAQRDARGDVAFECGWAVDYNMDAKKTYEANHPDAHAYHTGIDEFLWLCKKWKELSDRYPDDWTPADEGDEEEDEEEEVEPEVDADGMKHYEVEEIRGIRLQHNAPTGKQGQSKGQLLREIRPEECWLEFSIKWKGYEFGEDEWNNESALACEEVLAAFVRDYRREGKIPLPGDVALLAGGPPCQGISGLNRHAETEDILKDVKNRLVKVYYQYVEHFKPSWILMEQVQDILTRKDGLYVKFANGKLIENRYQARTGIIMAGDQGCPQGRNRCFIWGARSGVCVLAPFPEPSHRFSVDIQEGKRGLPTQFKHCYVHFLSDESRDAAQPHMTLGDAFTDLPVVHNYTFADGQDYKCAPQRPYQIFMRREPPSHQADRNTRIRRAEKEMEADRSGQIKNMLSIAGLGAEGVKEVGWYYFCTKDDKTEIKVDKDGKAQGNANYAKEVWENQLAALGCSEEHGLALMGLMSQRAAFGDSLGKLVAHEAQEAERLSSQLLPLRDHRPWPCNADDYLRMTGVPMAKGASFREMVGVVTHTDRTCCSGHFHAYKKEPLHPGGAPGPSACPAGGACIKPKPSKKKSSRVDTADADGWRGTHLPGCPSFTSWLPTGDLQCPRWCITYKGGRCMGRHGCYGRMWWDEVQSTVVTRAQPHNLRLLHPEQDRVATVRENARCQGFPDYYVLVGTYQKNKGPWAHKTSVTERYLQIGNAVAPPVASALGRCLVRAAAGACDPLQPILAVPDQDLLAALEQARSQGLRHFLEEFPDGCKPTYGPKGNGGVDSDSDSDEDEDGGEKAPRARPSKPHAPRAPKVAAAAAGPAAKPAARGKTVAAGIASPAKPAARGRGANAAAAAASPAAKPGARTQRRPQKMTRLNSNDPRGKAPMAAAQQLDSSCGESEDEQEEEVDPSKAGPSSRHRRRTTPAKKAAAAPKVAVLSDDDESKGGGPKAGAGGSRRRSTPRKPVPSKRTATALDSDSDFQ